MRRYSSDGPVSGGMCAGRLCEGKVDKGFDVEIRRIMCRQRLASEMCTVFIRAKGRGILSTDIRKKVSLNTKP